MSETTKTAQTTTAAAPREIRAGELASWLPRLWLSEVGTTLPGAPSMEGETRGYAEGWRRFTESVLATKLDCCVSSAYDGASVDGLNKSLADKYLSTDPAAAFLVPTSVGQGDLSRYANGFRSVEGYGGADFDTEHESLLLEADDVVESSLFADAAVERRRADSLFARSPRRSSAKAATRRVAPAAVRPLSAPARAETRRQAVVQAYPAAMGKVGQTPRSRVIQGLQALRLATESGLAATPATLAMLGDAVARGPSWSELGATVDAFRPGASANAPPRPVGASAPIASAPIAPGRLGAVTAARAATVRSAQAARETMGSGATRRTARSLPALAAAMSVSDVAWPQTPASAGTDEAAPVSSPRSAGVFSPGRIAGALHVATLDGTPVRLLGRAQPTEANPGYRSVEFDASEQSWLQLETEAPARFDASTDTATVRRPGRAVPAARAAAVQIARRLPAAEAARLSRDTAVSPIRPAAAGRPAGAGPSAPMAASPAAGRDLPRDAVRTTTALPSVIAAPVAELGGWTPERVNAEVRRQLAVASSGAPARYLTAPSTSPMGRVASSERGAAARLAPRQVAVPELAHLVPAAARSRRSGSVYSDVATPASLGGVSATGPTTAAPRAYTTGLRLGGVAVSGTTTSAEVFAELRRQSAGASLSANLDAARSPASLSGEVRVSAGAYAGGFDDPVIYLALNERAGAASVDSSLPPTVARAHRMSPSLRTTLDAVTAPLSQVVAAGPAQVVPRFDAPAAAPLSARPASAARGVTITALDAGRTPLRSEASAPVAAFEDRMSPLSARRQDGATPLRALDAASADPSYYAVGDELESAFLRLDVDHAAPMAGSHVELRQGRVVKMVPATASAARDSRVQAARVAERRAGLTPVAAAPRSVSAEPGIRPGAVRTLSVGASRVERPTTGASAVLSAPLADHSPASLRAATALGDAAALPGIGSRPADPIAAMLERLGGPASFTTIASSAPQSAALDRLASLVEAGGASARTAVAARLTALGVDVPELLRATREVSASRETDGSVSSATPTARRATGGAAAQAPSAERRIESARSVESLAANALARLSGLPSFGRATPVVESDRYFGTFAPARLEQGTAAGRLASLLSGEAAPARESRLSVTAELGDMLRLRDAGGPAAERLADSLTAADRVAGRSKQTLGAGMRVSTKQNARFDAAAPSAKAPVTAPAAGRVAGPAMGRVAGPAMGRVAELPTLGLERPSVAQLTRELQSLPAGSLSSLVDRLGVAPEPWQPRLGQAAEAESAPSRVAHLSPEMPALGLRAFEGVAATDSSSPATPRSAAARAATATSGRANAPATDGSRWFRALGPEAARQLLSSMPGRRALSSAIPGGLDLSATVIDRANGSFANLDAGIVEFLQTTAARLAAGEARDLRPGLDEWPEETLEILQAAGWGQGASSRTPDSVPGAAMSENTVSRLERRVDAARQAWARVQESRSRGSQSRGVDNLNWDLVKAGTTREAPASADLGRLASTMVKQRDLPAADMAYVAPAVKVVAAQAQLSERPSGTGSSGPAQQAPAAGGESGSEPQKVDYMSLARRVLPLLSRLKAIERDRRGG